jgi:hypothetical protein
MPLSSRAANLSRRPSFGSPCDWRLTKR